MTSKKYKRIKRKKFHVFSSREIPLVTNSAKMFGDRAEFMQSLTVSQTARLILTHIPVKMQLKFI